MTLERFFCRIFEAWDKVRHTRNLIPYLLLLIAFLSFTYSFVPSLRGTEKELLAAQSGIFLVLISFLAYDRRPLDPLKEGV